ncbi:MAG TPA: DUF1801 domain-containing protein [Polyangiaceae bacterium]|nr:DUF1801 domain-containing protein [Polyangiaceae bacterium]
MAARKKTKARKAPASPKQTRPSKKLGKRGQTKALPKPAKKPSAKKASAAPAKKKAPAPMSTPARDARKALELKKTIKRALAPQHDDKAVVDAYMRDVDHPFKAEMQAVRQIILAASDKVSERIKWNAPSFFYKEDLGAFNPRATEYAHLILLFPDGAGMEDSSDLLEGKHKDRREAKFHGMDDVKAKKPALEKLVKRWVAFRDR